MMKKQNPDHHDTVARLLMHLPPQEGAAILKTLDDRSIRGVVESLARLWDQEALLGPGLQLLSDMNSMIERAGGGGIAQDAQFRDFRLEFSLREVMRFFELLNEDLVIDALDILSAEEIAHFVANLPMEKAERVLAAVTDEARKGEVLAYLTQFRRATPAEIAIMAEAMKAALARAFTHLESTRGADYLQSAMAEMPEDLFLSIAKNFGCPPHVVSCLENSLNLTQLNRKLDVRGAESLLRVLKDAVLNPAWGRCPERLRSVFLEAMSARRREMFLENVRYDAAKHKPEEVRLAIRQVVLLARRLEESGELVWGW